MTPDLHPEELLDKAALGTLTDAERVWLDQHLAQCSVCRFEQQARVDFADVPHAALDVDGVVTRALSGLPSAGQKSFTTRSRQRSFSMLAAAALALTTMASFAAVAQWTGVLPRLLEAIRAPPPAPPAPAPAPVRRTGHAKKDDPEPPRPAEEPVLNVEAPPSEPAPAAVAVPARRVAPVAPAALSTPPIVAAVPMPPDAGSLFSEANDARVRGDRPNAVRLYRDLLERYPGAPEARLSQATLGRLLLDSGDPAAALEQLDTYLRGGELTLREEVLSARAIALSRLGRTVEEAAAWSALLEGYPDSIHAPRARARLQELHAH